MGNETINSDCWLLLGPMGVRRVQEEIPSRRPSSAPSIFDEKPLRKGKVGESS